MNKILPLSLLLLVVLSPFSAKQREGQPTQLVFTHVTVIDATGSSPKSNMTVVITNDRITEIGATGKIKIPQGAQIVDASNKFLIPGLWDMHVHDTCDQKWGKDVFLPMFIANGVTGVRDMGGPNSGDPETVFRWRQEIKDGKLLAPRLFAAGYMLAGPVKGPKGILTVSNESEARQAVDFVKQAGADFVKVKEMVSREAYFAIADEAHKQRIPLVGHIPTSVDAIEVADAGQRSIEHLDGIWFACSTEGKELREESRREELKMFTGKATQSEAFRRFIAETKRVGETYSEQKAVTIFKHLARSGTWVCPTLAVVRSLAYAGDSSFQNDPRLNYIPNLVRWGWDPKHNGRTKSLTADDYATFKDHLQKSLEMVRTMHRAGVKLLAGTDTSPSLMDPLPYLFPGFSLHDELALYVKAGLTPLEALQTATRNPAQFLGLLDRLGTVEKGKLADLVLLEANPLQDIANTEKINAVVVNGRFIDKAELQRMLADAQAAARK